MTDLIVPLLAGTVAAATPLIFAALGELITEKSGVLNLGLEGMMLMGAIAAFAAATTSGSLALGVVCGALAGAAMAGLFGVLALSLLTNQVATGLALTIFGTGLSAFVGQGFVSLTLTGLQPLPLPGLSRLPGLGPVLFEQN
ncbi:MAG: ABC transporter permease, partial [Candidatus Methylomirabilota bacterium]